jgi:uncharacterized protein involved in response to NO
MIRIHSVSDPTPSIPIAGGVPMSPSLLATAPHRLFFFVGATNVLLAMLCWTLWLVDARWQVLGLPPPPVHAGWLHAIVMQYLVLPPFIFGFLLTVFPRWMNQPALARRHYLAVGIGLLGGQALTLAGLHGAASLLTAGALLTLAAWALGLAFLSRLLWRDTGRTWHAVSCAVALGFGLLGLALYAAYLHLHDARLMLISIKLAPSACCCRSSSRLRTGCSCSSRRPSLRVMPVGVRCRGWRHSGAGLDNCLVEPRLLWLPDAPIGTDRFRFGATGRASRCRRCCACCSPAMRGCRSQWRSSRAERLVRRIGNFVLGRAPAHAMFIGFRKPAGRDGTRVTHGHSGRPLALGRVAGFAFIAIQCVAALRIAAELLPGAPLQVLAAFGWLVAFVPWALRSARIYLAPRADGKAG